jgi:hypothetical protein
MRMLMILAVVALVMLQSACSGMTASPIEPLADVPFKAIVDISRLGVYPTAKGSRVWWDVSFRLRETGGRSGAVIEQVSVSGGGDEVIISEGCWRRDIRVEPGGIQDTFLWGPERDSLSQCAPGFLGRTVMPAIRVVVTFVDDSGVRGSVEATLEIAE